MIKITTISPTKCYIESFTPDEIVKLKKELTYSDTSAMFALKKLKANRWFRDNHPHTYNQRKVELEASLKTCMLQFDVSTQKPWFHPGSLPYLAKKFDFNISSVINYPEPTKISWRKRLPFDLYEYQDLSVDKLIEAKHACVELCTGAGKTAIILTLARELGLNTIIVTPSKSIFKEILKKFEYHFGKGNVGAYGDGKKRLGKRLTVCISKSLTMLKEDSEAYKFFSKADVVIGDESHTLAANTLEKVFHGVAKDIPYRFFLSGTQVRGDGKDKLLESIIGGKVFELTTKEAIAGGYICDVNFTIIETTSKDPKKYSDPIKSKRKHVLYNENIADISAKIANSAWNCAQESTLILVEELCQIEMLVARLTVPFEYVHSASKKDAAKFGLEPRKVDDAVEAFNNGTARVLIGTSCISTGTNMYPVHNCINWVGGSSETRTKQGAVGRSVRLLDKSEYKDSHKEKPFAKIYDFDVKEPFKADPDKKTIVEKHLQKRVDMYRETTDNIKFVRI
tara:strand:+ start:15043 stop:16572 length:1530 start_codon:yes stop_codon:yes gene_type:complete